MPTEESGIYAPGDASFSSKDILKKSTLFVFHRMGKFAVVIKH